MEPNSLPGSNWIRLKMPLIWIAPISGVHIPSNSQSYSSRMMHYIICCPSYPELVLGTFWSLLKNDVVTNLCWHDNRAVQACGGEVYLQTKSCPYKYQEVVYGYRGGMARRVPTTCGINDWSSGYTSPGYTRSYTIVGTNQWFQTWHYIHLCVWATLFFQSWFSWWLTTIWYRNTGSRSITQSKHNRTLIRARWVIGLEYQLL